MRKRLFQYSGIVLAILLLLLIGLPQLFRSTTPTQTQNQIEEYNFHIGSFEECPNEEVSTDRSKLTNTDPTVHKMATDYLDLRYNKTTKLLTIETKFNNSLGNLPTGFHFAISKGPRPQGFSNLAAIYFDAKNQSNIKVLGYAYNVVACHCANYLDRTHQGQTYRVSSGSWKTAYPFLVQNSDGTFSLSSSALKPDPVFSSLENNSPVVEKFAQTFVENGVTYRKFRLVLYTDDINKFVPEFLPVTAPYTWEGVQFLDKLGLRFWAVNAYDVAYNGQGLFTEYQMGEDCSVCGYDNATTNASPICKSIVVNGINKDKVLTPGSKITASITAYDPEKNDLQISYSGAPTGSNFSVANSAIVQPNNNGEFQVNFDWTAGFETNKNYTINVLFTQQYGVNKAQVNCPINFKVAGCEEIDWRQQINTIDDLVNQQLANHHVKKLARRIKSTRGRLTKSEREISNRAGELGLEAWRLLFSLDRQKTIRQNCGSEISGCEKIETTRVLTRVSQITDELYGMVGKLAPSLRKALTKKGITGKQNTRRWRPIVNSATNIKDNLVVSINSLPSEVFACEKIK